MGVVISKPAINLREQLTELKATQGYEEQQFHFDGLVTNGTFDTDLTGWTDNSEGSGSTSWSSGVAVLTNGGSTNDEGVIYQTLTTVTGSTYVLEVDRPSGSVIAQIGTGGAGSSNIYQSNNGTGSIVHTFVATSTATIVTLRNFNNTGDSQVDNVSVYEVDPADDKVIHTMPKGWKPLHVFEDGALQREGSAYDYTVEYDGFNYIVKETVAPVAPYSTTVIGVRA